MAEAPAAPTTPAAPAAAPGAKEAPKADTKAADTRPAWSDADDAEVFERLKKAPWARVKVKGQETPITSRQDFDALVADAQRGRGANKLVEDTKKEREEARKAIEEANQLRAALEAAKRGDKRALEALGMLPSEEADARQKEWEALPPEVRKVIEENHKLREAISAREAKEKEALEAEKKTKREALKKQTLERAQAFAKEILADVRMDALDVEVPDILLAMRTLTEAGAKLGRDYDASHVKALIERQRAESLDSRFARLKPDAALKRALPHLKELAANPEALEQALGEDFEAVARAFATRQLARYRASKSKPPTSGDAAPSEPPRPVEARKPLPAARWQR